MGYDQSPAALVARLRAALELQETGFWKPKRLSIGCAGPATASAQPWSGIAILRRNSMTCCGRDPACDVPYLLAQTALTELAAWR